jgi:hypothetical protein
MDIRKMMDVDGGEKASIRRCDIKVNGEEIREGNILK